MGTDPLTFHAMDAMDTEIKQCTFSHTRIVPSTYTSNGRYQVNYLETFLEIFPGH